MSLQAIMRVLKGLVPPCYNMLLLKRGSMVVLVIWRCSQVWGQSYFGSEKTRHPEYFFCREVWHFESDCPVLLCQYIRGLEL